MIDELEKLNFMHTETPQKHGTAWQAAGVMLLSGVREKRLEVWDLKGAGLFTGQ